VAARGEIPKRLVKCRVQRCQSCLYGRATKQPWRTKGQANKIRTVTKPGECVSVDQLESPVPGFIGQTKDTSSENAIRSRRSSWTISAAYRLYICRSPPREKKHSKPRKHSRLIQLPSEPKFSIITPTMVDLPSDYFWITQSCMAKECPFVESMHIFKMGSRRNESAI
jgi:hypothetical protein